MHISISLRLCTITVLVIFNIMVALVAATLQQYPGISLQIIKPSYFEKNIVLPSSSFGFKSCKSMPSNTRTGIMHKGSSPLQLKVKKCPDPMHKYKTNMFTCP